MTRGTNFLNNSKCAHCKKMNKVSRPYGHMSQQGNLALKGYCPTCNHTKSLPYTKAQLDIEGKGIKGFFKGVYNKVLKPLGKEVVKNVLNNPDKAFQIGSQLRTALGSKNPSAILNTGMRAGKFGVLGQGLPKSGAVKIGQLTDGSGFYMYRPK